MSAKGQELEHVTQARLKPGDVWEGGAARPAVARHGVKLDEVFFYREVWTYCRLRAVGGALTPRKLFDAPGCPIARKRGWYCLEKWAGRGWYEWGVNLELGWLTSKAPTPGQFEAFALGNGGILSDLDKMGASWRG